MNKRFSFLVLLLILLVLPLLHAADNTTTTSADSEASKITHAYSCLDTSVQDKGGCKSLSMEQKIFYLLATGKCKSELLAASDSQKCWPEGSCNLRTTAQSIIALDKTGGSTSTAEQWLLAKNITPTNLEWYLQIDSSSNKQYTCTITYDGKDHIVTIGTDGKISSSAGTCLTLSDGSYWLKVSPSCYNKDFDISCSESFFTTTFFKQQGSTTIHISEDVHPESAEGQTTERINSACLSGDGRTCDYEGTLWGALALTETGTDVSAYIPYLITSYEDNEEYLPEAFLYLLTGEFQNELLLRQTDSWWDVTGDKFADTALAMYALQDASLTQKDKSKEWLLKVQSSDGCWGGIQNTAFILYSAWKNLGGGGGGSSTDCEYDGGGYCMPPIDCKSALGSTLSGFDCAGSNICCDRELPKTCSQMSGEKCDAGQECTGSEEEATDGTCCIGGRCREQPKETECASKNLECRTTSCDTGEKEEPYECDTGEVCCSPAPAPGQSYWWIWLLVLLIILVVLGIIFRDKLQPYWYKLKSKFSKGSSTPASTSRPGPPGFPPRGSPTQRKIFPPTQRPQRRTVPSRNKPSDFNDVLNKLKDMGK